MPCDPEVEAMSSVVQALADLPEDAQARVLEWAAKRYDIAISAPSRTTRGGATGLGGTPNGGDEGDEGDDAGGSSAFPHFADLFDALNPTTDMDRALTGAYWFQVVKGASSFQAQQVNNVLKDVGHGVENIARALANLQERSPALVRQLSKSGRTKQARKTYKLTTAGVASIATRLSQS
ncbi:MAG: hypothetical protein M3P85_12060 [Actinomycetota bacterium]|nr:hypothetical protein [Actinomycetota bacterium]